MAENAHPGATRGPGWAGVDLFGAATALLLPLLFATPFRLASWTPRFLALPIVAAVGLAFVPRLLRGTTRQTAILAALFGGWAAASAAAAPVRAISIWGRYAIGTGVLFVLALVGAWAIGTTIATRPPALGRIPGTLLVERALIIASIVNAAVAMLQQVTDLSAYGLATLSGRSAGLYGNPVYLAELLAGGLWLAVTRLERASIPRSALLVVVMSAGIDLSGSRFGIALAVLAAVLALARFGPRRASVAAVLIAVGFGVGTGLAAAGRHPGTTGVARTEAAPESGVRPRLEAWRAGAEAVARRPILGWGPSGFLAATSARRTLAMARSEGPDRIFADGHNIVVEYAVTTGIPGVLLLLGWSASALGDTRRRSRPRLRRWWTELPPLGGFALFVFGLSFVEPLHVGVTPLAFLALGAAAHRMEDEQGSPTPAPSPIRSTAVLAACGVIISSVLGTGLTLMRRAEDSRSPSLARTAATLLPAWAEPATVVGRAYAERAVFDHEPLAMTAAIRWWTTAAHRDPDDPGPWSSLGGVLCSARRYGDAESAFIHAVRRNPWSASALNGLISVDRALGRTEDATARTEQLARLGLTPRRC